MFDAVVTFSNGGGLKAEGFRVDVPGPEVTAGEVGELFVAALGLLLTERVEVRGLQIVPEPHRGTRGGPSAGGGPVDADGPHDFVELSHVVTDGMVTYPGLPGPQITPHLTREASRAVYAPGTEFAIDRITMVGNTGTYLDSPYHRYPDGADLAGLPLEVLADLPAVVVRTAGTGRRAVDVGALAAHEVRGRAVLLHTGGDAAWGTPGYAVDAPYLTEAGARWLVDHGSRLVGIDAVNIDGIARTDSAAPGARRRTRCCSPPASPWSSTSPAWTGSPRTGPASPPSPRASPGSGPSRSGPTPPWPDRGRDRCRPPRAGSAPPRCWSPTPWSPAILTTRPDAATACSTSSAQPCSSRAASPAPPGRQRH